MLYEFKQWLASLGGKEPMIWLDYALLAIVAVLVVWLILAIRALYYCDWQIKIMKNTHVRLRKMGAQDGQCDQIYMDDAQFMETLARDIMTFRGWGGFSLSEAEANRLKRIISELEPVADRLAAHGYHLNGLQTLTFRENYKGQWEIYIAAGPQMRGIVSTLLTAADCVDVWGWGNDRRLFETLDEMDERKRQSDQQRVDWDAT